MNRSCIISKLVALMGEGLRTKNQELEYVLKRINSHGEGWNDVFEKAAQDYLIYGGYALNIIWNELGDTIIDIYHMDFNDVRSGHIHSESNRVEFYYYSADWGRYKKDIYKPRAYKSFSIADAGLYPNQILYAFKHSPGQKYYPVPQYSGSLTDIQVDVSISSFHYYNLQNGLNPSLFVQMHNGIPSPEERPQAFRPKLRLRLPRGTPQKWSSEGFVPKCFQPCSKSRGFCTFVVHAEANCSPQRVGLGSRAIPSSPRSTSGSTAK
jgi:hypothetical protein